MAISDKDRKNLWGKAGNRCALCKVELFTKEDESHVNIGEECHIVSGRAKGPRHKELENYDIYDNLILLCRNHHKQVDELVEAFSEEVLRYIKADHENWVKLTLDHKCNSLPKAKFLFRITSGNELANILANSHGIRTEHDDITNKHDAEYIGGIAQDFLDTMDILDVSEPYDVVQISFSLQQQIADLEKNGYYLFGERRLESWKFGENKPEKIPIATLYIKRIDSPDIKHRAKS